MAGWTGEQVGGSAGPPAGSLVASLLGPSTFIFAGRPIRGLGRKARAVLAYLLLSNSTHETRERLVGLLWSEADEGRARASLRQTLREIRQAFAEAGYEGLRSDKLVIGLEIEGVHLDVAAVLKDAEEGRAHSLLLHQPRLADSLLQDLDDIDPEFHVWLLAKRNNLQERLLRALEAAMRREDLARETRGQLAAAAINLDPTHEEACRLLMRARAEAGDIGGALKAYKQLWDVLDEEYDMEPSQPTQNLVADIKSGAVEPATAPSATPPVAGTGSSTKLLLSVRAADMRGLDTDRSHLIDGFRQHLIACLVRFREWYVTDQSLQETGAAKPPDAGACYEINILAQQGHGAIVLTLTLKETPSNIFIWSEAFELTLEGWLDVESRIVMRLAGALQVHISTERIMRTASSPDVSLSVYDRWLRCQRQILTFGPEDWKQAEDAFSAIIAEAPGFTAAYCNLVQMNNTMHIVHPGVMRSRERTQRALDLARKAVQIDPIDSRAQLCLGWSHAMLAQYESAELHMSLARELNPQDPWTLIAVALFDAFCGRFSEASELSCLALDRALQPSRTHWGYQVSVAYLSGDYEGAVWASDLAMDTIKTLPAWRAAALYRLGRQDEARENAARFLATIRGAWCADGLPTEEAIMTWLLHLYPMRHRAEWERLREGLHGAGLALGTTQHGDWWSDATRSC
jgi:DNA-binding SARP family transcriptional activator